MAGEMWNEWGNNDVDTKCQNSDSSPSHKLSKSLIQYNGPPTNVMVSGHWSTRTKSKLQTWSFK